MQLRRYERCGIILVTSSVRTLAHLKDDEEFLCDKSASSFKCFNVPKNEIAKNMSHPLFAAVESISVGSHVFDSYFWQLNGTFWIG
jgi:hypothetical protein